jgi:hypothetical protein
MAFVALAVAALLVLATPESLWAWGPTTHAWVSSQVLGNLQVLPLIAREIIAGHPYSFLYGSLSADITLAKRYVHYSRNCHNWNVAYEILDRAETPRLQSFALGYLSHLAADTIAHNTFVPRLLVSTPLSSNLGHTYWEYRFDAALGDRYLKLAREVVTMDHGEEDALLELVLTQAFFSFQTNKRIFQQLIHLSNQERWRNLWVRMSDKSRWELSDSEVSDYGDFAVEYVNDFLLRGAASLSQALDPTGSERLALAKKLRRQSFREARRVAGRELAAAPISATRSGEAVRMLGTRPIPRTELTLLAAVYFPDPARPPARGTNGALPDWFESRESRPFWDGFTRGQALPSVD